MSTAESETLLKESHEWTLRRYGSDHPTTFGSMMNLGVLYEKQGNLQAAEQITALSSAQTR
jgi:Tetratricopeptide repeat